MKIITFTPMVEKRQINPAERKTLTRVINRLEKDSNAKLNWKAIIILPVTTIFFAIHINDYENDEILSEIKPIELQSLI